MVEEEKTRQEERGRGKEEEGTRGERGKEGGREESCANQLRGKTRGNDWQRK